MERRRPQRCQSVYRESTVREKGPVNACPREAPHPTTPCPPLPLNSHVSCSKCSCDFCLGPCERKGQHPGGLKPEPEAEAQRKDATTTAGSPAGHAQGGPTLHWTRSRQENFQLQGRSSYLTGAAQLQIPRGLYRVHLLLLMRRI